MRELKRGMRIVSEEEGRGMLKIGEVSKRGGVSIEALRFYEKGGLLDRPSRTMSGYRVYGEDVLERIEFLKRAPALGFSLDEIRQIVDDARRGESPCDEVREIVRRRMEELDERLRGVHRYREGAGTAPAVVRAPATKCARSSGGAWRNSTSGCASCIATGRS